MFEAPYPPYDPTDKSGFSYDTVVKRWPVILTGIVDRLHRVNHDLTMESQRLAASTAPDSNADIARKDLVEQKIKEGKDLIERIGRLKYRMARDHELEPIPSDDDIYVEEYNADLTRLAENHQNTWFTAPWLYAECYLYRLLRAYFNETTNWQNFDPFFAQKEEMFRNSGAAIYQIATTMHELDAEKKFIDSDSDKLGVLFKEMIQMCLWGNATDLSLLTHLTQDDIEHLQTVGKDAQQARKEFILRDDQDAVWEYIKTLQGKGKRVDFILDNAGFELFTDFVFADFMVTYTPYVSQVVFHPKLFPWFVSDVTPFDFASTITSLLSTTFFPPLSSPSPDSSSTSSASLGHLEKMVTRWQSYLGDGTFTLSTDLASADGRKMAAFWNGSWPYWDMRERAPALWEWLSESGLVIFKGDLNYRKLAGDVQWPPSTPFETALGPLARSFPLLSLRTNKADVAVGIEQKIVNELDAKGEKWRVSGKYALISFLPGRS